MKFYDCLLTALLPALAVALSGINDKYTDYDPLCAHACLRVFTSPMLSCSDMSNMDMDMMALSMYTWPECFANDDNYLKSMAYCMHTRCPPKNLPLEQRRWFANDRISDAKLVWFWENRMTGNPSVIPKWTYGEALARVTEPPTRVLDPSDTLNYTALANDTAWTVQAGTLWSVYREGVIETNYG